ncbi:Rib/alpha-like domain-containing protein [Corynebacterium sp. HS2168-gen11]|uniref:Rib/alpha-like domain-containing protein n=1 Tax=Corynebacterium sp. HS2168-gen11 TaxID=2974027 RepID=UPI00216B5C92|nr:Rib/alpha-like domain-containing protein [Corynebacterium sp. HS2168-gen11]MCS4535729.1 Rib/alpha-like domain-containing protein [Corynebacterium sp. HS2168-gen11]
MSRNRLLTLLSFATVSSLLVGANQAVATDALPEIQITEASTGFGPGSPVNVRYLEVFNTTNHTIDLDGWTVKLEDSDGWEISGGSESFQHTATVAAGQRAYYQLGNDPVDPDRPKNNSGATVQQHGVSFLVLAQLAYHQSTTQISLYNAQNVKVDTIKLGEIPPQQAVSTQRFDNSLEETFVAPQTFGSGLDRASIPTQASTYTPKPANDYFLVVDEPIPAAHTVIENVRDLPAGTTFRWQTQPDPRADRTTTGVIVVHYPDNSEETVTVEFLTEAHKKKENTRHNPVAASPTVTVGAQVPAARTGIANADELPTTATFSWQTQPDLSQAGSTSGIVLITYADGSTTRVEVRFQVNAKQTVAPTTSSKTTAPKTTPRKTTAPQTSSAKPTTTPRKEPAPTTTPRKTTAPKTSSKTTAPKTTPRKTTAPQTSSAKPTTTPRKEPAPATSTATQKPAPKPTTSQPTKQQPVPTTSSTAPQPGSSQTTIITSVVSVLTVLAAIVAALVGLMRNNVGTAFKLGNFRF